MQFKELGEIRQHGLRTGQSSTITKRGYSNIFILFFDYYPLYRRGIICFLYKLLVIYPLFYGGNKIIYSFVSINHFINPKIYK